MKTNRAAAFLTLFLIVFATACGSTGGRERGDGLITTDVQSAIANAVPGKVLSVQVTTNRGIVTLTGNTDSEEDRRRVGDAALKVRGVKNVINNILVQ